MAMAIATPTTKYISNLILALLSLVTIYSLKSCRIPQGGGYALGTQLSVYHHYAGPGCYHSPEITVRMLFENFQQALAGSKHPDFNCPLANSKNPAYFLVVEFTVFKH